MGSLRAMMVGPSLVHACIPCWQWLLQCRNSVVVRWRRKVSRHWLKQLLRAATECLHRSKQCQHGICSSGRRSFTTTSHPGTADVFTLTRDLYAQNLQPMIDEIREVAPNFDFSATLPGNGYRSFLAIADKAVNTSSHIITECQGKSLKYDSSCLDSLAEATKFFTSLFQCFECLVKFKSLSQDGSLYASEGITIEEMIRVSQVIDQKCFYGRFIANAFENGIKEILKFLSFTMTSYSELYYGPGHRIFRAAVYAVSDKARAERHVALTHHASVDFITSFWALSESPFCMLPMRANNPVAVSRVVEFSEEKVNVYGAEVSAAYCDSPLVKGRLISSHRREGMLESSSSSHPKSRGLIIHVHGGGFVSQSSQSQEIFLRKWAASLQVPIFSIDYSLAPEARFPRPLNEVFFGYCSALANAASLGSTAERVVMVGDSAGANLILAAMLECIRLKIRLPDGLLLCYVPVQINFVPSPARLLGLIDPLLPFGVMMRCAKAYITTATRKAGEDCISSKSGYLCGVCIGTMPTGMECMRTPFLDFSTEDPLLSPYLASDSALSQLPRVALITSTFDPCLDDTIMFATRLRRLGRDVSLEIVADMPHGFLNFCGVNEKAAESVQNCAAILSDLLDLASLNTAGNDTERGEERAQWRS